jgi:ribosomal protein S18 acetylase RimI-like enzyme
MHPLDNPAWHALRGPHREFGESNELAARYHPDVALFAALPDEPTPDAWDALRALVGPGGVTCIFRNVVEPPAGWERLMSAPAHQMVAQRIDGTPAVTGEPLGAADVEEMLRLVARTAPGPFAARTVELGRYIGVRRDGALVAMAGERMHPPGYREISAVCTDEAHRGRGLASDLVRALVAAQGERGETPFLHVVVENASAIRVYEALGFVTRRIVDVAVLSVPA